MPYPYLQFIGKLDVCCQLKKDIPWWCTFKVWKGQYFIVHVVLVSDTWAPTWSISFNISKQAFSWPDSGCIFSPSTIHFDIPFNTSGSMLTSHSAMLSKLFFSVIKNPPVVASLNCSWLNAVRQNSWSIWNHLSWYMSRCLLWAASDIRPLCHWSPIFPALYGNNHGNIFG